MQINWIYGSHWTNGLQNLKNYSQQKMQIRKKSNSVIIKLLRVSLLFTTLFSIFCSFKYCLHSLFDTWITVKWLFLIVCFLSKVCFGGPSYILTSHSSWNSTYQSRKMHWLECMDGKASHHHIHRLVTWTPQTLMDVSCKNYFAYMMWWNVFTLL